MNKFTLLFLLSYSSLIYAREVVSNLPEMFTILNSKASSEDMKNGANGFAEALIDIRRVVINPDAFKYVENDESGFIRTKINGLIGQAFSFSPPNISSTLVLNVLKAEKLIEGESIITYSGKVDGDYYSSFTFSVDDEVVIGRVKHKGLIYLIEPNDALGGVITLSVLQEAYIAKDPNDFAVPKISNKSESQISNKSGGSNGHVKVLFKYASNVNNASTKAANLISDFNTVLSNSLVSSNNFVSSAGVEMVADTFSTDCKQTILF